MSDTINTALPAHQASQQARHPALPLPAPLSPAWRGKNRGLGTDGRSQIGQERVNRPGNKGKALPSQQGRSLPPGTVPSAGPSMLCLPHCPQLLSTANFPSSASQPQRFLPRPATLPCLLTNTSDKAPLLRQPKGLSNSSANWVLLF